MGDLQVADIYLLLHIGVQVYQPGLDHNTRINHGLVITGVLSILVPQADRSTNTSGTGSTHICLWMQYERIGVLISVVLEVSSLDYTNLDTRDIPITA